MFHLGTEIQGNVQRTKARSNNKIKEKTHGFGKTKDSFYENRSNLQACIRHIHCHIQLVTIDTVVLQTELDIKITRRHNYSR